MAYNKITLYGNQICDYVYIQSDDSKLDNLDNVSGEPTAWSENTIFFADFNNPEHRLSAGNSELIGSIDKYEIRRKKYSDSYSEYVGTIRYTNKDEEKTNKNFLIDYAVRNNVDYTYYLYPYTTKTPNGTIISPLVTKQVSIDCPYWSLFIVDESDEPDVYYLDKMFKFELNLQPGDMNNNAQVSIVQNFTRYPTVQYGSANYWSGSLTSLCGFIASNGIDYVQNVNMINELKEIVSDTRKKFLKDTDGNLWEVGVSAPLSIATEQTATCNVKTLSFSWVEVGSADGVSIIDNPDKSIYSWLITESGEVLPYMTYVWDDQYLWNESYYWTANDDSRVQKISNLGRNVEDGEK